MTIRMELVDLIEDKIDLIDSEKFDELFLSCNQTKDIRIDRWTHLRYELADALLHCGIDYSSKTVKTLHGASKFIKDLRLTKDDYSGIIKGPYKTKSYTIKEGEYAIVIRSCVSNANCNNLLNVSQQFKNYYDIVRVEGAVKSCYSWNVIVFSKR